MGKIICDVCGTSFPETATQCPICGCVRSGDSVTIAGDTSEADVQKANEYGHIKGGRFSKANVKKRNSGKPIYNVEPSQKTQRPQRSMAQQEHDNNDVSEDNIKQSKKPKKTEVGLIIVIIALLVAIAAVVIYITCSALGIFSPKDGEGSNSVSDSAATSQTTDTTYVDIACTALDVEETSKEIIFTAAGQELQIKVIVTPNNTTDEITFYSDDEEIAIVNETGKVTALRKGETVIYVQCGDLIAECIVKCNFEDAGPENTDTTEPTETTVPEESNPTNPTNSDETYTDADFTLYSTDVTFKYSSRSFNIYTGKIPADQIVWKSNDERVATVKDGVVTFVNVGRAIISATYNGKTLECSVRIY